MTQDYVRDMYTPEVLRLYFSGPLADLIGELLITLIFNIRQSLENDACLIRVILALFHRLGLETSYWCLQHGQLMKRSDGDSLFHAHSIYKSVTPSCIFTSIPNLVTVIQCNIQSHSQHIPLNGVK
jgi:hypothetical protein